MIEDLDIELYDGRTYNIPSELWALTERRMNGPACIELLDYTLERTGGWRPSELEYCLGIEGVGDIWVYHHASAFVRILALRPASPKPGDVSLIIVTPAGSDNAPGTIWMQSGNVNILRTYRRQDVVAISHRHSWVTYRKLGALPVQGVEP